jgi:hypothetical protein
MGAMKIGLLSSRLPIRSPGRGRVEVGTNPVAVTVGVVKQGTSNSNGAEVEAAGLVTARHPVSISHLP